MVPTVVSGATGGPAISSTHSSDDLSSFDLSSVEAVNELVKHSEHVIFHLFAGVDGASEAMRQSNFVSSKHRVLNLWFESDPWRQAFSRRRSSKWRRLVCIQDLPGLSSSVFCLTDNDCAHLTRIVKGASKLKTTLVISGSPCVGFSNANPRGKGILDTESVKLWVVPVIIFRLKQITLSLVLFLAENVVPKSKTSEQAITSCFQVEPIVTHAHELSPCKRSRLIWTNLSGTSCQIDSICMQNCLEPGWETLWSAELPGLKFGTFLRPFHAGRPSEYPAPYPRLPLSAYDQSGLVIRSGLPPDERESIRQRLLDIKSSAGDPRDSSSTSFSTRKTLCQWIHQEGGISSVRPLSAKERFLCLGFEEPLVPDSAVPFNDQFQFLQAAGNTFSVPVFRQLLSGCCSSISSGGIPGCSPILFSYKDQAEALAVLGHPSGKSSRH